MQKIIDKPLFKLSIAILLIILSAYKITQGLHWDETLSIAVAILAIMFSLLVQEIISNIPNIL
ncbi:MAG TPA: hypothetical protein PLI11_05985 [Clostridia bacterium]|jgi:hypothetical protein|nr:hypothetical protein [Clostridiaceae bacterium]HOA31975.1 hypothetical protein [Clostridia bacterium]HPZ52448.1 hypothetical protein [Clostridia bacterium]